MEVFRDIMIIVSIFGGMIFGLFIMKRLDTFLEQNRKKIEEENKKREPRYIIFDADTLDEEVIKKIEEFKKIHSNAKIVVYDSDGIHFS